MKRDGKNIRVGKPMPRRLTDGKNAWKYMTPQQRREFLEWMKAEGLEVAPK
jgi:hypothetical protein